jgi:hypothetical protein
MVNADYSVGHIDTGTNLYHTCGGLGCLGYVAGVYLDIVKYHLYGTVGVGLQARSRLHQTGLLGGSHAGSGIAYHAFYFAFYFGEGGFKNATVNEFVVYSCFCHNY